MRAVVYHEFGATPQVLDVPDPQPSPDGVVVEVEATGVCRSDWHGWRGHDSDITLPHVPGHELAGRVVAAGDRVRRWRTGDRVTVPFICACGTCEQCAAGDHQVCPHQTQPGFTHWGSFAELVALDHADVNLVRLPDRLASATAAALGCRFGTAYRAVVRQGRAGVGQWVAVHGCGGAGISAVMIAAAAGARVVAVDVAPEALAFAAEMGAEATVPAGPDAADAIHDLTGGGAHVSLDCVGLPQACASSVRSLRKRGRHVQVGLLAEDPAIPMSRVIADELVLLGSHGVQAHEYPNLLALVEKSTIDLDALVSRRIPLDEAPAALVAMDDPVGGAGVTVVEPRS